MRTVFNQAGQPGLEKVAEFIRQKPRQIIAPGAQFFDPLEYCRGVLRVIAAQDLERLLEQQRLSIRCKTVVEKHEGFGRNKTVGIHDFGYFTLVL